MRRNSVHTLTCRSGSLKKFLFAPEELVASSPFLETTPPHNPEKTALEIDTQDLFKQLPPAYDLPLKRSAGSMKIDHPCRDGHRQNERTEALSKELAAARQEAELLAAQCKKLKSHLSEEREKRRTLEEESRCSQQEIRRLEKRLEKYRSEKERYEQERDTIIRHIEELEAVKLDTDSRAIQSFRVKVMEEEVGRVRGELEKGRGPRERELLVELERLIELKYGLEGELKAANVANAVLTKQLEENEQEMAEIRESVHKTVTSSFEYVELRERYRKMLLEYRELQLEMSMMEKDSAREELEGTLLTISESEDRAFSEL